MLKFILKQPVIDFVTGKHFNTSHVEVYLKSSAAIPRMYRYFNTSHVEVYRLTGTQSGVGSRISIHLMLKFINKNYVVGLVGSSFQYISC